MFLASNSWHYVSAVSADSLFLWAPLHTAQLYLSWQPIGSRMCSLWKDNKVEIYKCLWNTLWQHGAWVSSISTPMIHPQKEAPGLAIMLGLGRKSGSDENAMLNLAHTLIGAQHMTSNHTLISKKMMMLTLKVMVRNGVLLSCCRLVTADFHKILYSCNLCHSSTHEICHLQLK